jgi:hypothetical protein
LEKIIMRIKNYPGAKVKSENARRTSLEDIDMMTEISEGGKVVTLSESEENSDKWRLGGCPRCHGDVFLDSEDGELLGHCLQCGYVGTRIISRTADT